LTAVRVGRRLAKKSAVAHCILIVDVDPSGDTPSNNYVISTLKKVHVAENTGISSFV